MTSVLAPVYSAKEPTITQRAPSTAILAIDSEDRFRDYVDARATTGRNLNPYSFTINKNQSLMNGFFTRVAVTEVVFPWVIPNINRYTRTMNVTYNIGAGPVNDFITLELGFYTPSMIADQIQLQVRAITGRADFNMTYGVQTTGVAYPTQRPIFEYEFTAPGATIAFSPFTPPPETTRKQLFDLLGFTNANITLAASGIGLDTYCQTTRYVDIVCTQLTLNAAAKDTMSQTVARDVLCRVYVGDAAGVQSTVLPSASTFCPPGCMPTTIYRDFALPKQIQWRPDQSIPGYLQFDVYDDAGFSLSDYTPFAQGNGANWSMTLLCSEN